MCPIRLSTKYNLSRHVKNVHDGQWECGQCQATFYREVNFGYHSRTCNFKSTGERVETAGKLPEQRGGERVTTVDKLTGQRGGGGGESSEMAADDPEEIRVEIAGNNLGPAMKKLDGKVSELELGHFYISLHVKYRSRDAVTALTTTNPSEDIQEHYTQLTTQLEENESDGLKVEKFLHFALHIPIEDRAQALHGTLRDFSINLRGRQQNVENIYEVLKSAIHRFRNKILQGEVKKVYMALHANFHLSTDPTFITDPPVVLHTKPEEVLASTNINEVLENIFSTMMQSVEDYELRGSGWILNQLLRLDLHILRFDPLRASTYLKLPEEIRYKRAVVNIQNSDNLCFLWSVIAGIYDDPNDCNPHCVSHYKQYEHEFKMDGIEMPMAMKDIPKFERRNNVSISLYGFQEKVTNGKGKVEEGYAYPLKTVKEARERHVNLLIISRGGISHYCLIRNFSRLVRSQVTKHKGTHHFCRFCLHGFTREDLLKDHEGECFVHGGQKTVFPENTVVEFTNIAKQMQAPFTVYADFESVLESVNQGTKKTKKYQLHTACSYSYIIISNVSGVSFSSKLYVGGKAAEHLLDSLEQDMEERIMPIIENEVDMIFNEVAREKFETSTHCHICEKLLNREGEDITVRDHCHFTGIFRGAAHQSCNLQYRVNSKQYKLPIFFHNLRGYDAHLIMQAVRSKHRINVIPNNFERYISFSIGNLKFLDSMQFLNCSLAGLVENLKDEDFVNLKLAFPDKYKLLSRKGVYPYDYMSSFSQFGVENLPSKGEFYNRLNDEEVSDEDYVHAQNVWKTFNCITMKDYHDLYLRTDVLLLADVFEKFRAMSLENYGLDPAHYYSLPGLSWDAALKYSNVKLDLIVDIDMYQMVERGIRGGVSMISHRYAEASESCSLIYLDANSLYSWAMSQPLPVSDFQWCKDSDIDVTRVSDDAEYGFILEVDLTYPPHLHDTHNDYPLAPEKVTIARDMLSSYQLNNFPESRGCEKLVPNLRDKSKYVIHYRNLKTYLDLGLKLVKIHRVIKFRQSPWLKSYIDLNIEKRKEATKVGDKVGKDLFKLCCNAVFGKTMENQRNRVSIELVTSEKIARKRIAKPNFKRAKRFHDELVGIHMQKAKLELNRPIQVGFAILDISKLHMYNFHYNVWMANFPKSTLLFTDTDSLCYAVEGLDIVEGMGKISNEFDFSEYPENHPLFDKTNMKVVGKFKDELHGRAMLKFVGLRPKLYSYTSEERGGGGVVEKNTAKGVKTRVKNTKLTFADYEHSLRSLSVKTVRMNTIRSDHHRIFSQSTRKIGLSAFDDKRYILEDGISTRAHGHRLNNTTP